MKCSIFFKKKEGEEILSCIFLPFPVSLLSNEHIQSPVNKIPLGSKQGESSCLTPVPKFSVERQCIVCERKSVLLYPDFSLNKLQNHQSKPSDNFAIDQS